MGDINTKVLIVGGGPGGYVAAIRAGQLGLDVVLVEEAALGGTCLNVGGIPSKALIHAAEAYEQAKSPRFGLSIKRASLDFAQTVAWKDGIVARLTGGVAGLVKKAGVKTLRGRATIIDGKNVRVETGTGSETIRAEHIILATGSEPVALPGVSFGGRVISSTEALSLPEIPKRLTVVGAGYIGLELGIAYAKLGTKVTVVEMAGRILPLYDAELTRPVEHRLGVLGVEVLAGAKVMGLNARGDAVVVEQSGGLRELPADKILVAVGRRPRTRGFGLEQLDLAMSGPFIRIDERSATSMRNVWAIGDVTGEPMLAHRAMAQGEMVAEIIAGHRRAFDKRAIAAVCFTDPEIVSAGWSPEEAKAAGHELRIGRFPFMANGRA
ncbi:MAG: dihydrolipoyl dehydrogenase, partial [Pseudomonadota bacterium]